MQLVKICIVTASRNQRLLHYYACDREVNIWCIFCLHLLQDLMERLDSLLCGDGSESLKSLCLKLLLCLVTVRKKSNFNHNLVCFGRTFVELIKHASAGDRQY